MDKLLRDMDALCQTTAKEREEMYRKNCIMAEIMWKEQQLTDEEMATIKDRDDMNRLEVARPKIALVDSILSHGSMVRRDEDGLPIYGKPCDETFDEIRRNVDETFDEILKNVDETFDEIIRNMIDELQGMADLLEYMNMIEDCDIDDMLNQLEANILLYNEGT